ncbi:hypothetical protein [Notoacmeibacter sp. MSK16QG-6]|nr:hypothetical protein [Notoacmeibacter sp. MSK16QG-6]MCP1200074.1 hypothetical protein [Notoacmeibacter sp. MSK16QG-6]
MTQIERAMVRCLLEHGFEVLAIARFAGLPPCTLRAMLAEMRRNGR